MTELIVQSKFIKEKFNIKAITGIDRDSFGSHYLNCRISYWCISTHLADQCDGLQYGRSCVFWTGCCHCRCPGIEDIFPIFRAHPLLFQVMLSLVYQIQFSDLAGRLFAAVIGMGTVFLTLSNRKIALWTITRRNRCIDHRIDALPCTCFTSGTSGWTNGFFCDFFRYFFWCILVIHKNLFGFISPVPVWDLLF